MDDEMVHMQTEHPSCHQMNRV